MRLFCFHHAGGGRTMFSAWNRALGPGVEVIPVEIANRERFATLRQLVDEINDQLGPQLDGPHMFFGHSFGGSDDPLVSETDLHEWRWRTSDDFAVHILSGGHFYLGDGPRLFAILRPLLSTLSTGGAKC